MRGSNGALDSGVGRRSKVTKQDDLVASPCAVVAGTPLRPARVQNAVVPSGATLTRPAVIPSGAAQRPAVIPSGARAERRRRRGIAIVPKEEPLGGTERQTLITQIALSRCARTQQQQSAFPGFQGVRALERFPAPPRRKAFQYSDPLNASDDNVVTVAAESASARQRQRNLPLLLDVSRCRAPLSGGWRFLASAPDGATLGMTAGAPASLRSE